MFFRPVFSRFSTCVLSIAFILISFIAANGASAQLTFDAGLSSPATSSSGAYTVTWTSSPYFPYQLQESANGGAWITVYNGSAGSKSFTGKAGGTYKYRIYFRFEICIGSCSLLEQYSIKEPVTVVSSSPPSVPSSINSPATDNNGAFTVSWGAATAVANYELYQKKNSGGWARVYSGSGRSKALSGLGDGSYLYRVRACNSLGCSAYRTESAVTLVAHAPGVPATISFPFVAGNNFTISWAVASGSVDNYQLFQQKSGGSWVHVYSGSASSKAITNLAAGTYLYRVRACNAQGSYNACSAYLTAFTTTMVSDPPSVPVSISTPLSDADGSFTISWGTSTNGNLYELYQQKNGGAWTQIYRDTGLSKAVSGLGEGTYRYRVRSCGISCGGYRTSSNVAVTFPPGAPGAIAINIDGSIADYDGNYSLSWGAASGVVTRYEVYESVGQAWTRVANSSSRSLSRSGMATGYYSYRVRACNATFCGPYAADAIVNVQLPSPTTISVSNNDTYGNFRLAWTAKTGAGSGGDLASVVSLQEQFNGGAWLVISLPGQSTSVNMVNKPEGSYSYRITSCSSIYCAYEVPHTVNVTYPPQPKIPGAIQGSASDNDGIYTLTWGASSVNVGSYQLEEKNPSSSEWQVVHYSLSRSADIKVYAEGNYQYRVKACNANDCSTYTATKTVSVNLSAAILTISPAVSTTGSFTLSWSSTAKTTIQKQNNEGGWDDVITGLQGVTSRTLTEVLGVHLYRLIHISEPTVNSCQTICLHFDSYTNLAQVEVVIAPPVPSSVTGPSNSSTGDFSISWGNVPQADYYLLERKAGSHGAWQVDPEQLLSANKPLIETNGVYWYRAKACSNNSVAGCSVASAQHQVTVQAPAASEANDVAPYTDLPSHDSSIGAIGLSHEVGNDGSASLSIPIATAPGVGGVQPQLALSYSSNAGNGEVGVGWNISGLSTIHRCDTNFETDDLVDSVDFDDNDQFCIDGQRLVAVQGANGEDDTEYRTEFATYQKITSQGSEGTLFSTSVGSSYYPYVANTGVTANPESFIVRTRDGRIIEFGKTDDSRLSRSLSWPVCAAQTTGTFEGVSFEFCSVWGEQVEPRTYQWMINKVTDRYGNEMTFIYDNEDATGEQRIEEIRYNSDKNKVVFEYEDRDDVATGYFSGGELIQRKRLSKVSSYSDTTALRVLKLGYNNAEHGVTDEGGISVTKDSLLTSIQECAGDSCLPATNFEWTLGTEGFELINTSTIGYAYAEEKRPFVVDFNGDGRSDLLSPAYSNWKVAISDGQGFEDWIDTGVSTAGWNSSQPLDYNGDGKTDLLIRYNGYWRILQSTGNIFQIINTNIPSYGYNKSPRLIDMNGDGRSDLVYVHTNNRWHIRLMTDDGFDSVAHNTGAIAYNYNETLQIDYNADGRQDLLVPHNGKWEAYLGNGLDFEISYTGLHTQGWNYSPKVMDVNGDGLSDLVTSYSSTWHVNLNKGGEFTPEIHTGLSSTGYRDAKVSDFNRDGRSDLIYPISGAWKVLRANGQGFDPELALTSNFVNDYFVTESTAPISGGYTKHAQILDIDGSGLDTFVLPYSYGLRDYKPLGRIPDYLLKATNGFGVETIFKYNSLVDDSAAALYDIGTVGDSQYPVTAIQGGGTYVVSQVQQSDGLGGYHSSSYQYREKRAHVAGLGDLGFKRMITLNDDTGIRTEVTFSHDYANRTHGMIKKMETIAPGEITTSLTENTYDARIVSDGSIPRYRRLIDFTEVSKYDLNGSFLHREESDYQYDGFDNPTLITSRIYSEGGGVLRTSIKTNDYDNDFETGLMGLIRRAETSMQVTGKPEVESLTTYDYDLVTGRKLFEKTHNPVDESVLSETRFAENAAGQQDFLDDFGNSLAITVTGPDFVTRDTKVSFDIETGRFPQTKTNALGHETIFEYYTDNDFGGGAYPGKVKITTAPNGLKTYYEYDSFGRTRKVISAYSTSAALASFTHFDSCAGVCRPGAAYRMVSFTEGSTPAIKEVDVLGRTLKASTLGMNGQWVSVDYNYNHLGHNTSVSEPYFAGDTVYWNNIEYDVLGRPTETVEPSGRRDTVNYNGLINTAVIDADGKVQSKTQVRNPLGNLVSVMDTMLNTTSYQYDSAGRQTHVTDPASNTILINYDVMGRKTAMNDPDKGVWQYRYNGLGQLITQTDAKGQTTCNVYDILGRNSKRIDDYQGAVSTAIGQASQSTNQCAGDAGNVKTAVWNFNTAPGITLGTLNNVQGEDGYQESFLYDSLGRVRKVTSVLKGETYVVDTNYDAYSRPDTVSYPTSAAHQRLTIKNVYNALGYPTQIKNAANENLVYHSMRYTDAKGNLTLSALGNGAITERIYDEQTGYMSKIKTFSSLLNYTADDGDIQDLDVNFDAVGNLDYRSDALAGFYESFRYDNLNRLRYSDSDFGIGTRTHEVTYDNLGNIKTKDGVGTYSYGGSCNGQVAGPHAVTSISGTKNTSYCYDANGNMVSGDGRTINYTAFDKPDEIIKGSNVTRMQYGPSRNLYYREDDNGSDIKETTMLGGVYERVVHSDGKIEERHTIGGVAIETYTQEVDSSKNIRTRYLHTDHLGSLVAISDDSRYVEERFSFDAWGKRRATNYADMLDPDNWSILPDSLNSSVTNKGFTGHEQLDGVGLIHMGGRVYDADIGRFLSADPFVQDRTNLQALNRYSYVENNPLSYTDPSGYFLKKLLKKVAKVHRSLMRELKRHIKRQLQKIAKVKYLSAVISAAMTVFVPGCQTGMCATVFNAAMTAANGGTFADIVKGAAIGLVAAQIGGAIGGGVQSSIEGAAQACSLAAQRIGESIGSALAGGIAAKAQGAKFIDGVKGAAITAGLTAGFRGIKENLNATNDFDVSLSDVVNTDKVDPKIKLLEKAMTIDETLKTVNEQYDVIIVAHGSKNELSIYGAPTSERLVLEHLEAYVIPGKTKMKWYACNTGKIGGLAQRVSAHFNIEITAPNHYFNYSSHGGASTWSVGKLEDYSNWDGTFNRYKNGSLINSGRGL